MEENVPQKTHQKMTFKDLTDEKVVKLDIFI